MSNPQSSFFCPDGLIIITGNISGTNIVIYLKSHANKKNHFKLVIVWAFLESDITIYLPNGQQQSRVLHHVFRTILRDSSYLIGYMRVSVSGRTHSLADPDDFVDSWSLGYFGRRLCRLAI